MNIIIDKSFLDGAPTEQIKNLCEKNIVLFPETLFFELMTTSIESQKRCFSKISKKANPVALIPNVGTLLRYEINTGVACTPLIEHAITENFQFNAKLCEGTFIVEGDTKESLEKWKAMVKIDTENFLVRCSIVHQFFPELNGIEYKNLPSVIEKARIKVAQDHKFVKSIYKSFLEENTLTNAPNADLIDPNWVFFRWVQCQLVSALRMFDKYQGKFDLPASNGVFIRAEHTMHDIYYTILATLSGALATEDKEIIDDFLLLCPDGILVAKN